MKKIFLSAVMLCMSFGLFAQEIRTTEQGPTTEIVQSTPLTVRGYKILPAKGDLALGMDLNFLGSYFINAFSNTDNNTNPGYSIYMKYFLEDNRAVRARLGVNIRNDDFSQTQKNDFEGSTSSYNNQTVIDIRNYGLTNWNLDLGYEFRRGYRRIQGYYGGEIGFEYENAKDNYSYGNPIANGKIYPSSTNFDPSNPNTDVTSSGTQRILDANYGAQYTFRAQAFVGVEYFIGSRLSIGAEFGLGLGIMSRGQDEITAEKWDMTAGEVREDSWREYSSDYASGSTALTTNTRGNIYLMFHF